MGHVVLVAGDVARNLAEVGSNPGRLKQVPGR